MKKVYVMLFVLLVGYPAFAQYNIKDSTNVLTKKERAALEQVVLYELDFYNKVQPDKVITPQDTRVNIFSNYGAYLIYQKEQTRETHHNSAGFYSRKNKEVVVCKDKHESRFLSVCYHELSHFFINVYFNSVPIWLNEGLAVYFGHSKTGKTVKHQVSKVYIVRVKTMIDLRDMDLKDFVGWDSRKFYKKSFSQEGYGYALGYSIVQYLMQKDEDLVIRILREINSGKKAEEAIAAVYDGGFSKFESDFVSYITTAY